MNEDEINNTWQKPAETPQLGRWFCPVCELTETLSDQMDRPMHRHKYGNGTLQTGFVLLQKVEDEQRQS